MEECVGDLLDGSGHGVGGIDGADDRGPSLIALAVLHTDGLEIRNGDEILPYLACETVLVELLTQDRVCLTQRVQTIAGDRAEAANAESGTRERLTVYHAVRQTECLADNADFVLEQESYGLDQLKLQIVGPTL